MHPRRTVCARFVALATLLGAAVGASPVLPTPGQAAQPAVGPGPELAIRRVVPAAADASVSAAHPSASFGTAPGLLVDASPRRVTYLRFEIPDLGGRVTAAHLRLHVADRPGAGARTAGTVVAVEDDGWDEASLTWDTRPALGGARGGAFGPAVRGRWVQRAVTALARPGDTLSLAVQTPRDDDVLFDARGTGWGPRLVLEVDAPPEGVVVDAVGDLVCGAAGVETEVDCHEAQVSDLIVGNPATEAFLALGDLQYNQGTLSDFETYYEPTYGRVRDLTYPVIGNHKYLSGGDGYWDYFGDRAGERGEGWYAFDLGDRWHLVALNSNCDQVACGPTSAQVQWLRADLAANDRPCVLAFFHHPRWSSATQPRDNTSVAPFVRVLHRFRAEAMLSGHAHNYERFPRLRPDGTVGSDGIRQFVVGTGGRSVGPAHGFTPPFQAHSQFRIAHEFGLLRMSLTDRGMWWSFVAEDGRVLDSGTDRCR